MTEPAFPGHTIEPNPNGGMCRIVFQEGMLLRDYFAAKAMHSILTTADIFPDNNWRTDLALDAYRMADAMLEARK